MLARDVVASLRRWGARDTFGGSLFAVLDELAAPDDRTVTWRLKRPFPLLPDCLGKEMIGSGPYRFVPSEYVSDSRAVYARFDGYVSRSEPRVEQIETAPDGRAAGAVYRDRATGNRMRQTADGRRQTANGKRRTW